MITRRAFLTALGFAAAALPFRRVAAQRQIGFEKSKLTIVSNSSRHDFDIEIASTPDQHQRGLMFRRSMAANAGMLFDYRRPQRVSMWMRNTYIPLDMLFIDANGVVTRIAERTVPLSQTIIPSKGRVRGVLELNGGSVSRLGIKIGDRIEHPIFVPKR